MSVEYHSVWVHRNWRYHLSVIMHRTSSGGLLQLRVILLGPSTSGATPSHGGYRGHWKA